MSSIKLFTFKGEVPSFAPHLLPNEAATLARDCQFDGGELNPIKKSMDTGDSVPSNTETLFRYEDQHWFSWSGDVDAIKSPIARDQWRRVYWTDGVYPKVTYNTIFNGSGRLPAASYRLGVPAPANAPGIKSFTPSIDPENEVTIFYVLTYSTGVGEEGMPGPTSIEVRCFPVGVEQEQLPPDPQNPPPVPVTELSKVVLTLQPPLTNISNINRINIYRTTATAGYSEFLKVASVPIATAEYTDSIPDSSLGGILETETFAMPPDEMKGLCVMANGICAGFVENEVLFSESYLPYAWPEEYQLSIEEDVVAIEPIGTSLVVGTTGDPYLFSGVSPGNIANQRLEIAQACASKNSMCNIGMAVLYASPDGIVGVAPDGVRMMTDGVISPRQWRELVDPSTIRAFRYEGKYVATHSKGAFIFDPVTMDLRQLSETIGTAYTDPTDESLYFLVGGAVHKFQGGADSLELTWRSKEFVSISKSFSCVRIDADDINLVSFRYLVDGKEVLNRSAGNVKTTFTLPSVRGDSCQFELSSKSSIKTVRVATSKQELKE